MNTRLTEISAVENVTNVVIFISDSLRFDALPNQVSDLGLTFRAISASTSTKSSLPSITSGKYPTNHDVWSFNARLSARPKLLEHPNTGFNAETIWTHLDPANKPPMRMNYITERTTLDELESPYVYVEHDKGGHSPYGKGFDEFSSTQEFFNHYSNDITRIVELYHEGVKRSAERFLSLYEDVCTRGELAETLLIFTSDHGELLGEAEYGGIWDHGSPVVPELVSIPVVFIGGGLPAGEMRGQLLSGTDIAPTALGAMGEDVPPDVDGTNLWSDANQVVTEYRSEYWSPGREFSVPWVSGQVGGYKAVSLWNLDGGIVVHQNGPLQRMLNCHYTNLYGASHASVTRSTWDPRRYALMLGKYLPRKVTYGNPAFAAEKIDEIEDISIQSGDKSNEHITEITKEQLKKLGYLE